MSPTVVEITRFEDLRQDWDNVLRDSAGGLRIFSTWDWQRIWWELLSEREALRILAVRDGSRLIGIWPLMHEEGVLALVGGVDVCDYLDIIALRGREEDVLAAGLKHVQGLDVRVVDLRFLHAGSPTIKILPKLGTNAGWRSELAQDDVCPAVTLPADWETYLGSLSKKDRHELRRKLRRLGETRDVQWQITTGSDGLDQDVADFLRLHRGSGTEKAAFMTDRMSQFFRAIIAHYRPQGLLKIYFLALDGQRVATTLCIDQGDELWVYNSGFDRDYAYYSVGLAIKAFCIQSAIAEGKRRVDFLRGPEPYKYDLGARDEPVWRLQLSME